ncbi:MAG: YCF48-related protein [Pyrinomonadaceae bacterium]
MSMRLSQARRQSLRVATLLLLLTLLALIISTSALVSAQLGWSGARYGEEGKDLNAVYFADNKRGWIGGDGGYLSRTIDGGHSWSPQTVGTTDAINDIYFRNKDEGYLLAGDAIFNTRDGGQQWRELRRFAAQDFDGASPELYSVRFSSKKKGWVVGSLSKPQGRTKEMVVVDSLVFYTDDGGASWQRQPVPTKNELIHLDFVSEKRGWIVGTAGTILHTEDGGDTWRAQQAGTGATLYHVDFQNEDLGWIVGERGTILRTMDGGHTWTPVRAPLRATLLSVQFVDDNQGWIVGRGGTILRSDDGGRTWIQQESKTKQNLYALYMNKKFGWSVGGDGMVLQYER